MKKLFVMLCAVVTALSASARFHGVEPQPGQSYYLYNIYQAKFLSYGNEWGSQVSLDNTNPVLCTVEQRGSKYVLNTHMRPSASGLTYDAGYNNYMRCEWASNGKLVPIVNANYWDGSNIVPRDAQEWSFSKTNEGYYIYYLDGSNTPIAMMFFQGTSCYMENISYGYNVDMSKWLFIPASEYVEMMSKKMFSACCINVDGMPCSMSIASINIDLNPDGHEAEGAKAIGKKLRTMGYDIIGVSEDFNFHNDMMNEINDLYDSGTNREHLSATLAKGTEYLANRDNPTTAPALFDTDGLGFLTRKAACSFSNESWTKWNQHYGYDKNGGDGMIAKGYRYYTVTLKDGTKLDVYILHMDAESEPEDNAARATQIKQLADAIIASHNGNPIIVLGDTNCRYTRDALQTDFIDYLNADPRFTCKDAWIELVRHRDYPELGTGSIMVGEKGYRQGEVVDKIFYINNTESNIRVTPEMFRQDISYIYDDGTPLSDHWPMVVEFSYHNYTPAIDDVEEPDDFNPEEEASESVKNLEVADDLPVNQDVYLRNVETGWFLKSGGWWGTHAMQGDYGLTMNLEGLPDGTYAVSDHLHLWGNPKGYVTAGDPYMDNTGEPVHYTVYKKNGHYIFASGSGLATIALTADDPAFLNISPNQRYVTSRILNPNDRLQQWDILTKEQLLKEAQYATAEHPANLTFLLPGANFDANDNDAKYGSGAWNNNISSTASRMNSTLGTAFELGWDANPVAEANVTGYTSAWSTPSTTWDINQTLTGMPSGNYNISCFAFYSAGSGAEAPVIEFYANSNKMNVVKLADTSVNTVEKAGTYFNAGNAKHELTDVSVTNGTLKVGIRKTSTTPKKSSATVWTCFDNFQILYYPASPKIRYDVNGDGKVSLSDLCALVDYLLGETAGKDADNADCDCDGTVTFKDIKVMEEALMKK